MINRPKKNAFILPMVLGFMLLSHIIYLGIITINQTYLRHTTLLSHYYQKKIQIHLIRRQLDQFYQLQVPRFFDNMDENLTLYRAQLLYDIDLSQPLMEDHGQFGTYYFEKDDHQFICLYAISIFVDEKAPLAPDNNLKITPLSQKDILANRFDHHLIHQIDPTIETIRQQIIEQDYQEFDHFESMDLNQWDPSNPEFTTAYFNTGWVNVHRHQNYLSVESYLDESPSLYKHFIPWQSHTYRFYGEYWLYRFVDDSI